MDAALFCTTFHWAMGEEATVVSRLNSTSSPGVALLSTIKDPCELRMVYMPSERRLAATHERIASAEIVEKVEMIVGCFMPKIAILHRQKKVRVCKGDGGTSIFQFVLASLLFKFL